MALSDQEELEMLRLRKAKSQSFKTSEPKEPGFGEKAGAFAYGAATGSAGGAGELEKFGAYDVPEFFGADVKKGEAIPFGRETIFPTMQETEKVLGKVGIKEPREEVSGYRTAGEILGSLGTAIPGVMRGGKALLGSDLVRSLLGKKTKEQATKLAEEATTAGKTGEEILAAKTAGTKQQAESTAASQEALKRQALERQQLAEKTAGKETARGGRSLRDLLGVRTLPEAGSFRPIPQTPAQVGGYIREQAEKFLEGIKTQRSKAADTNFTTAKSGAATKEAIGQNVDTNPLISKLDSLIEKGGSSDYLKSIQALKNDIERTKGFEGLEIIRRRLGDAAFGAPEEGYKAIGQGFSKDLYKDLSTQMRSFEPAFAKYLDDYKRLSEPISVYTTKLGKGLTETVDSAGKYYSKTAEQVAKDIFSSPEKYSQFVDAVGGNKQIAEAAARRYFAGLLETAKTPSAVEKVIRENRSLLGVDGPLRSVAKELEYRYLAPLQKAETRTIAAGKEAGKSEDAAKTIANQSKDFDKDISATLKNVTGSETLFSDAVKALSSAKPKDAVKIFDNTVLPKIRQAEEKAGVTLLNPTQLNQLRTSVIKLEKVADQQTRNRLITGIVGGYFLGKGTISTTEKLIGN